MSKIMGNVYKNTISILRRSRHELILFLRKLFFCITTVECIKHELLKQYLTNMTSRSYNHPSDGLDLTHGDYYCFLKLSKHSKERCFSWQNNLENAVIIFCRSTKITFFRRETLE